MELVVPWAELQALVEPYYPKTGNGRRPVGLSIMLRTYFMQQWFNLSARGVEEAYYESATLRRFAGVDLGVAPAPDETTVLRFRHLLEKHDLCGAMLEAVNLHLEAKGIRIATGTIDVRGQRVGRAHAARPAAWRRTQGVGRRWLPGSDQGDPAGRAEGPGHDLQAHEVQDLCR
jgi:hypothetical protein